MAGEARVCVAGRTCRKHVPRAAGLWVCRWEDDEARAEADARALARLHPATREAVLWQEAAASEPLPSDEDSSLKDAVVLVGRDEAGAWLGWARQTVAHLILERAGQIEAVADELAGASVMSGRRMLAVMRAVPYYARREL